MEINLIRIVVAVLAIVVAALPSRTEAQTVGVVVINPVTRNESTVGAVDVAANKKAAMEIVVSPDASKTTRADAEELASILEEITGAKFNVATGDGAKGIVLGTLAQFPNPALDEVLEIYPNADGREAYAIRTSPGRVLLLGATELGATHAAFRFLEEIGYRHFFPHPAWEVVPKIESLSFDKNITDRPSILARDIWFEAGSGGSEQENNYTVWKRHNAHAQSFVVNAGHNLFVVPTMFPEEFKAHPEYYAQTADGKPIEDDLELVNPKVRQLIVEYARRFFQQDPNADMVSIDPTDRPGHSQSPAALKIPYSDQIFGVANEVAQMLQKEFPGKMVGLYSYSGHWDPPSFKLEPNVHVLMSGLGQGKYTPAERAEIWPTLSQNLGYYEYYSVWLWSYDKLPGSGTNDIRGLQNGMQARIQGGATSVSAESTSSWGSNGRGYFFANKLMWNPDIDVDATAQDFYDKAFGAGASAMKRYYDRLNPGNRPFMSKHLLGQAFRDVKEASDKTKDDPKIQARLDQIKLYLNYVYLDWLKGRDNSLSPEDREQVSDLIMRNLFRTRGYALTSWEMIRQQWGGNKYPGQADSPAWMEEKPYTREEIDANFDEAVQYFQPSDIGEAVKYSDDLVPVVWPEAVKGQAVNNVESKQDYQGAANYYFYSIDGEPLKFLTYAGDAWGGINRFVLKDAKGVEISHGTLPNKESSDHNIEVPGPGLYKLEYNDNGSYWSLVVPPATPATLPMGQNQDYRNSTVMQDMYFYVPKGVKKFEYYYTRTAFHPGGPHQVFNPNGEAVPINFNGNKVTTADINGDWASVDIPAGMDGKLWRFHEPVLGLFWFNNVPNNLAASPDALIIPREVAIKDGLQIRK